MSKLDSMGKRIFVVDDNPDNLGVVASYLKGAGYKVAVAPNGGVALERVGRIKPVVILLDVKMPGLDGFDVCRKLKERRDSADIPVIFLTALDDTGSITQGFRAGGTDYLSKPVNREELLARVATHVENYLYRNRLQEQVHLRTAELEEANRLLKAEIKRRKKTEADLHSSEERLDLAMHGANDGIWDWNLVKDTIYFDTRYYTMAGYEPNEFPGSYAEWENRLHPDDIAPAKKAVAQCLAGERPAYDIEFRFRRKEGGYMWIWAKGKIAARDPQGRPTRFIGTHADITKRKQIEKRLSQAKNEIQQVFDNSMVGIFRTTFSGEIILVNPATLRILGYDSLAAMNAVGLVNIYENPADRERLMELVTRGAVDSHETRFVRADGRVIDALLSLYPIAGEDGRLRYLEGNLLDITDRKRASEELRSLRNYLSNIINSMPSALVGVDVQGRVTQWNQTVEQATGIDAQTAQNKSLAEILPWMAPEMKKIKESIHTRQIIQEQKKPRSLEGTTCYEDMTIYPLITNGIEGAVIRIDDVTDKVQLEEMIIQSEKMLSVGGLAAGMAHEINNPLAGMLQTAEVMANRLGKSLDIPASREAAQQAGTTLEAIESFMANRGILRMLDTLKESGRRVSAIVDNMLSFARKGEARVSSHVLEEIMDKTLELAATDYDLKKHYDFKLVEIVREYQADPLRVPCERAKIQQVLLNILRNGAQAMQAAGVSRPRLTVRTGYDQQRAMAILEIEDNGPGMDAATRKRVFEPFFTTKPTGMGTGLGLSVSYFIIAETHGGELAVESPPGAGAKFIMRLPMEKKSGGWVDDEPKA